jgi:hypothetical protein
MADRIVTPRADDGTPPELLAPAETPAPFEPVEAVTGWRNPQRIDWPRFEPAPEDIPDPFGQHLWGLAQVLSWVYLGNRAVVRAASPQGIFESEFMRKDLRDLGRHGACYPHFANAEDAVIEALQAGRLTATGLANGEGDRKKIPAILWADLDFPEELIFATPKHPSRTTATVWHKLRVPRKDVLSNWTDPLESLAMADEQKTSTPAEGNANRVISTMKLKPQNETPVQRRARLTARHQELKAAGDPHPTKTVAGEEGISTRRVLQVMENKAKANEAPPTRPLPKTRR